MTDLAALAVWSGAVALLVGGGVLLGAHNERRAWIAALSLKPADPPRPGPLGPLPPGPCLPSLPDAPIPGAAPGFGPWRTKTLPGPPAALSSPPPMPPEP